MPRYLLEGYRQEFFLFRKTEVHYEKGVEIVVPVRPVGVAVLNDEGHNKIVPQVAPKSQEGEKKCGPLEDQATRYQKE